jgi:hypothetical protein
MKWSDLLRIKAEFPINLWPAVAQEYYRWLRASLEKNKPYDQFARELLTSSGSNFRVGPVNFYRALQNREPLSLAAGGGLPLSAQAHAEASEAPLEIALPAIVNGQMMPGSMDRYRFHALKGQKIVIHAMTRALIPYMSDAVPGWFQASLTITGA